MSTGEHFLAGLESDVRAELATADSGSPLDLFSSPESGWLVDPAEVQSEQTGLRSLLGAIQSLETPRPAAGGPGRQA